jgi:hypothetical protein
MPTSSQPFPLRPTTRQVFGHPDMPAEIREQMEIQFFDRVVSPNGTIKTTKSHRLDDLNAAALPFLSHLSSPGPLQIMDVGISSGVSTFEWHEHLVANNVPCKITGTDLTVFASLISLSRNLEALIDRHGNILHLDTFGKGTPPTASGLRSIFAAGIRGLFRFAMQLDRNLPPVRGDITVPAKGKLLTCEPVTLLTQKFPDRNSVRVVEEDLLAPERPEYRQAFHVLRAANILNRAYFPEATLAQLATKLKHRLKAGGLLIVCRTNSEGRNNASIFELSEESRLRVVHRLGLGSEIEDLLTAV